MPSRGSVSVVLLRPLAAVLANSREALEAFYAKTDLTPELLSDAEGRVSPAQFCVAWAEAVRRSGEPQLALRIASELPQGAFGIVEYVCRSAPDLGEAIRQWVRYLNLLDDAVVVGLVVEGDRASLRVITESEAPAPASHELCFALLVARARELSAAPFRPVEVHFTHRATGDAGVYEQFFGAPVQFGAAHTELVMHRAALDAKLVTADPQLLVILSRHADDLAAKDRTKPLFTAQIQRVLCAALREGDIDVDHVARQLGLTPRSLQRRLKEEGMSFKLVREEVRKELAVRYLDLDLSISEIAFLLGFSEPSAFFRAFKRWTGTTPLEIKAQRRSEALAVG